MRISEFELSRRRLLILGSAVGAGLAIARPTATAQAAPAATTSYAAATGPVANTYHALLLAHTRWAEEQWDPAINAYRLADFRFAVVLGNAVLLISPGYDPAAAGVDRDTLHARTVATIRRFAATNRLAGGTEWGRQLFWDSTFELYFVLAARLLWSELDEVTRNNVDRIARGQAAYAHSLGTRNDPLSGSWTPNGLTGGWIGDTKLEEMGVYAQAIAPGLAWATDDPAAAAWRERFLTWTLNATGLPAADRANAAVVDGRAVADWNTAHNIHDTFLVENHGSFGPHYQEELWRTAGRTAAHFLTAGQPLPEALTRQPSAAQLWRTMRLLASDAGEPFMPMVADRYHLYGRDVLPLAFLAQVQGDRHAARAEADLADRLMPYLNYPPEYRLTKFSGEPKYEPEARAELAISYLFHSWRAANGGVVEPVASTTFFAAAAGTRDFGEQAGLTAQQTPTAFAAAVSKTGYVSFLWAPAHDNWLFDTRAASLLPRQSAPVLGRTSAAYTMARDGLDATATVLRVAGGTAGYVTLPTGTVVYATTGIGADEGALTLFNLDMPGVPGLTGTRTFTGEQGSVTLAGQQGLGDGGTDQISFAPRPARYVRMLGRSPVNQYGYSLFAFAVLGASGIDLATGRPTTASSADPAYPAPNATDGNSGTRWAVAREERGRADSWLAVDLGESIDISGVRLDWEAAYGTRYVIQTSLDGINWSDAAVVPDSPTIAGSWLDVDGRAGLVVHNGQNPITVTATTVTLSSGPATGSTRLIIEGYTGASRSALAAAASRTLPNGGPEALRVSDADGYLSLFNLSDEDITTAAVTLSQHATLRLYHGSQVTGSGTTSYQVDLAAATARVEPPRFTATAVRPAKSIPAGTRFDVTDSHHLRITAPAEHIVMVQLESMAGGARRRVTVPAGRSRDVAFAGGMVTPTSDLARSRTTYPTSPLPAGMTDPSAAVDGDPVTAWQPGPTGRLVIDLGSLQGLASVRLTWTPGRRRPITVATSADGLGYVAVASVPKPRPETTISTRSSGRYVAIAVADWQPGDARLTHAEVFGA
ncbi:discoidin domain-containing protein [Micromonospora sp. RHAY321]|uniref:discoidin domain-containing protein n=1 Tax=Micromonospora sp. RHAY321 TaxID=2944807 RepID=UPI00207C3905|nr:discoidin domain-containing protein [Micromonospora sp. RHAY321]MCO1597235.1 discoidin domain-containing protein [Micromonospora sp. RHAY321]